MGDVHVSVPNVSQILSHTLACRAHIWFRLLWPLQELLVCAHFLSAFVQSRGKKQTDSQGDRQTGRQVDNIKRQLTRSGTRELPLDPSMPFIPFC